MDSSLENEIKELLASGNKIAAIKRFREETGTDLADAKAAVESLEAGGSLPSEEPSSDRSSQTDADLRNEVVRLLERGSKIEAVKVYREQTGLGLKESKLAVEEIGEQNGIPASSGAGCLGVVLLCISLGTAACCL